MTARQETPMASYRVRRNGNVDLVFDGEILSDLTSRADPDQPRWTEIRIYRTDTGRYVTETVGRSTVAGEKDRINVHVVDDPAEVRVRLQRKTAEPYLTGLALEALVEAAGRDERLSASQDERI